MDGDSDWTENAHIEWKILLQWPSSGSDGNDDGDGTSRGDYNEDDNITIAFSYCNTLTPWIYELHETGKYNTPLCAQIYIISFGCELYCVLCYVLCAWKIRARAAPKEFRIVFLCCKTQNNFYYFSNSVSPLDDGATTASVVGAAIATILYSNCMGSLKTVGHAHAHADIFL